MSAVHYRSMYSAFTSAMNSAGSSIALRRPPASVMPLRTSRVGRQPMRISSTANRQIKDKAIRWNALVEPTTSAQRGRAVRGRPLFDASSSLLRRRHYGANYAMGFTTDRGVGRYRISGTANSQINSKQKQQKCSVPQLPNAQIFDALLNL